MNLPASKGNQYFEQSDVPSLDGPGTRALEAWFLGPKAENAAELEELIVESLRDHVFWRRNFHPGDPSHITDEMKRSPQYLEASDRLKQNLRSLLAMLKKSVPFFSMRYQGHMNWDLTIPGIVGYFAAMLYNPNNVAFEGSTATTLLEMRVADDLCQMLGYNIPDEQQIINGATRPWGHITCDGTVANIEALWAARNVKFYPFAIKAAIESISTKALAIKIALPDGKEKSLSELDDWELLNIPADRVLEMPSRLQNEFEIPLVLLNSEISKVSLQSLGLNEFYTRFLPTQPSPIILVSGTKHYSHPKAAALLGLGSANLVDVPVDLDARMDISKLEKILCQALKERRPVLAVVGVMGSTEESAIDPLVEILTIREEFRKKGLDYIVHADAAWGGYHASTLRDDYDMPSMPRLMAAPPPAVPLSRYTQQQLMALSETDSITVDPHKSGYIPYPAGALCYRNSSMRNLVTFSAPVVFHGETEPTVGIYGIEGSKPGAAAASVFLSHSVIRPTKSGYGKIIGAALFSCKKLYAKLLTMAKPEDLFVCVPLPRLPIVRNAKNGESPSLTKIELQYEEIRKTIAGKSNEELTQDEKAMALFSEIGPDQNILSYAFNFKSPDGVVNTNLQLMNRFNSAIYNALRIEPGKDIYDRNLIVSTTDLSLSNYGSAFMNDYKNRLQITDNACDTITVLRSVVMDPWITETTAGSFLDVIESEFRSVIGRVLPELMKGESLGK